MRAQKLKYKLERWRFHKLVEVQYFTNKKEAIKWLKNSFWWKQFHDEGNMIYIYKNNKEVDWEEQKKEWGALDF